MKKLYFQTIIPSRKFTKLYLKKGNKSSSLGKEEIERLQTIARNTLENRKRVSMRTRTIDLNKVKYLAEKEGLPYTSLMASVIHKYVTGQLVEKKD